MNRRLHWLGQRLAWITGVSACGMLSITGIAQQQDVSGAQPAAAQQSSAQIASIRRLPTVEQAATPPVAVQQQPQALPTTAPQVSETQVIPATEPLQDVRSRRLTHLDWQAFEQKLVDLWGEHLTAQAEDQQGAVVRVFIPGGPESNNQMVIDRLKNVVRFEGHAQDIGKWDVLMDLLDANESNRNPNIRLVSLGNATSATIVDAAALLGIPEDDSPTLEDAVSFAPFRATANIASGLAVPQRRTPLRSIPFEPSAVAAQRKTDAAQQRRPVSPTQPIPSRAGVSPRRTVNQPPLQRGPNTGATARNVAAGPVSSVLNNGLQPTNDPTLAQPTAPAPAQPAAMPTPAPAVAQTPSQATSQPLAGNTSSRTNSGVAGVTYARPPQQEQEPQGQFQEPGQGAPPLQALQLEQPEGEVQVRIIPEFNLVLVFGDNPEDVRKVREFINNVSQAASETQPISDSIALKNSNSATVKAAIDQAYMEQFESSNGQVTTFALDSPERLVIIGQPGAIEAIKGLVETIDKLPAPPTEEEDATIDFKVFRAQHMSAIDLANRLRGYFRPLNDATAQVQALNSENWVSAFEGLVSIIVDFRSNSVVVKGNQRVLSTAQKLVDELDIDGTQDSRVAKHTVRFFPVRNTSASDLAVILKQAINGNLEGSQDAFAPNSTLTQGAGAGAGGATGFGAQGQLARPAVTLLEFATIDGQGVTKSGILLDVRITADSSSNQLVVSGPESSMDLVEALINQLDRIPDAESQIKVFTVLNGDATELLATLDGLFNAAAAGGPGAAGPGAGANTLALPLQTTGATEGGGLINLRFAADPRTNSIIASGPAGDLIVIEDLLNRLDEEGLSNRINRTYRLSNAPAEDVAFAIQTWLDDRQTALQNDPSAASAFQTARRQVVVVPELVSNSLIISATPSYYEELIGLIEDLDRRPAMVKIKVLIAEINLNKLSEFGVEVGIQDSLLFDRGLGVVGFPFNQAGIGNNADAVALATQDILAGQGLSNLGLGRTNTGVGFGGLVLSAGNESINILLRALQNRSVARVLSTPDITTVDNLQGRVQVGQRVPRVTSASQGGVTGGIITNVVDEDVGVILAVTPRVSPDGMIIMTVDAVNSDLGAEADGVPVFVSDGQVVNSPPINITQAQTTVMARSGQTVAFSGLIQDTTEEFKRGTPILSDLPVIGPLFSFEGESHDRSELLIVLTPYLIDNDAQLEASNRAAMDRMHWCLEDVSDVYGAIGYGEFDPELVSGQVPATYYPDSDPTGENPQFAPLENTQTPFSDPAFEQRAFDQPAVELEESATPEYQQLPALSPSDLLPLPDGASTNPTERIRPFAGQQRGNNSVQPTSYADEPAPKRTGGIQSLIKELRNPRR